MILLGLEVPLWAVLTASAGGLVALYFALSTDPYKNSGLPGPRCWPLIGSGLDYFGINPADLDQKWRNLYGKIVITYDGPQANIMVYDPDFIKDVFIKQFDKLGDRRQIFTGTAIDSSLLNVKGAHWKHLRSNLSPVFSSGKLKKMLPLMQDCSMTLIEVVKAKNGEPVMIRDVMSAYTLEVIASTAFGIKVNCQHDHQDKFMIHSMKVVGALEYQSTLIEKVGGFGLLLLIFMLPGKMLRPLLRVTGWSPFFPKDSWQYLSGLCQQMMAQSEGEEGEDFIHSVTNKVVDPDPSDPDTAKDEDGNTWTKKGLVNDDVIGNAIVFIFAGFQTTADTSHFLLFELSKNQEVQQRAREEVMEVCTSEEITYEQLQKLHYLEWCINEALRLYPIGFRFDREVNEDFVANGVPLKKGTFVTVGPYAIHRDPEYWESPLEFDPERWTAERSEGRHNCAFIPFGYGPRACIGMRMAQISMKLLTARLLKNFSVEPTEKTPVRPAPLSKGFAMVPETPIELKFIPLDN